MSDLNVYSNDFIFEEQSTFCLRSLLAKNILIFQKARLYRESEKVLNFVETLNVPNST